MAKWDDFYKPDKYKEYYDLSGEQTAWTESLYDMKSNEGREAYEEIETKFIDELYGTEGAEWATENRSEGEFWQRDEFDATWGMDLRRTMLDEDGGKITSSHPQYYEHLTRGDVDWASYENDSKYVSAFKEIGESVYQLTDDDYSDAEKVSWIREANQSIADTEGEENKDKWKTEWDGKYDPDRITRDEKGDLFIEGERQQTLQDLYNSGEGRLPVNSPGEHTKIKSKRVIGRPNIPGVTWTNGAPTLTNPVKPSLPKNARNLIPGANK